MLGMGCRDGMDSFLPLIFNCSFIFSWHSEFWGGKESWSPKYDLKQFGSLAETPSIDGEE